MRRRRVCPRARGAVSVALAAKVVAVATVTTGAASAGWLAGAPGASPPDSGVTRAWIDDPLDGAALDPGAVEVVAHAADPDGVAALVLFVDGAQVASVDGGGDTLERASFRWPAGAGEHELRVVGRDRSGDGGDPGIARVRVGATETPTTARPGRATTTVPGATTTSTSPGATTTTRTAPGTTAVPTTVPPATTSPTTAPSTTVAPTTAPCTPSQPRATSPDGGRVRGDVTFSWDYTGCTPSSFALEVYQLPVRGFPTLVYANTDLPGSARSDTTTLPACNYRYRWRVRAAGTGGAGPWSAELEFDLVC